MTRGTMWLVAASALTCTTVVSGARAELNRADASPPSRLAAIGGVPKLPIGKVGSVAVVARGTYENYLPVVVRNNTKRAVADIHVAGTALDSKGRLLLTGEDQGIQPEIVPRGGLAIGYVYFGGKNPPSGTRFKLDVKGTPADQVAFESKVDVPITTLRYVSGRVVGIAKNTGRKKISGPLSVYAACFGKSNRFVAFASAFANKDSAAPGEQVPFTVDLTQFGTRVAPACAHVLVSMRGYSF